MPESIQHKLDRVRRPRVQITYDVETLGSIVKTELPFVVGIMADLSGNAIPTTLDTPQPANTNKTALKDRKFVEIDRDNFNTIMEKLLPSVKLTTQGYSDVSLTFKTLEDFNPINVLRNVPELKDKFESRTRLSNLVAKLDGNLKLQKDFVESYNRLDANAKAALQQYWQAMNPPPGTPSVTDAETTGGNQTTTGLVITPDDADGGRTKYFKITGITGGKLFQNDGKTEIPADSFITVDDGGAGLKFTPDAAPAPPAPKKQPAAPASGAPPASPATPASNGSFTVQAATGNTDDTGLIGNPVNVTITVKPAGGAQS